MASYFRSQYIRKFFDAIKTDPGLVAFIIGTSIGLAGFCMTDPVNLRSCCIVSGLTSIFYNLTRKPMPLYAPTYWSLAFLTANGINIYRLLLSNSSVELSEEQDKIYTKHFIDYGLRPREFLQLVQSGTIVTYKKGTYIRSSKRPEKGVNFKKDKVYLLLKGNVEVSKYGELVGTMTSDTSLCFLGEMSLLQDSQQLKPSSTKNDKDQSHIKGVNNQTSAIDHLALTDIRLLEWNRNHLLDLLRKEDEFSNRLKSVFFESVRKKLMKVSKNKNLETYRSLLQALVAVKKIDLLEKKALKKFREVHSIDYKDHILVLHELDWTEEDYYHGAKHDHSDTKYSDNNIKESLNTMLWKVSSSSENCTSDTQISALNESANMNSNTTTSQG